ncbi:hypothetical protein WDW37_14515 [Bdellovibrionota bacterium FG-1]
MNHFILNGKAFQIDVSQEQKVQEFMDHVRRQFNSDAAIIASIRVNGNELDGDGEAAIAELPLSEIDSVEVFTAHPRELAEETLQSLMEFTTHLEKLSRQSASKLEAKVTPSEFLRLVDGIETFTDALMQTKQILRIGRMEPINVLEADLASILKDLVEFTESGQKDYVIDLLKNHLPINLEDWRREGIPALIRSRDS